MCLSRYVPPGVKAIGWLYYTDDEPESADTETANVSNIFGHATIHIPNIFLYHQ